MQNLVPALLPRLEEHQYSGLNAGPDSLYPFYEGYSLVNIPSSVCQWLGAPPFGAPPLGPEILNLWKRQFRHVILLVVDGLGLDGMQTGLELSQTDPDFSVWASIVAGDSALAPITSIAPSTTAAALTSLWTGVPPSAHGVVAYEVWLKEYNLIANMILHSPASFYRDVGSLSKAGFKPDTFLPVPTLGPHLQQNGVRTYAFQHHTIAHSGLSVMLFPGVEVMPFRSLGDLWMTMNGVLNARPNERNYLYAYWGELDELSHRFNPGDERVRMEYASFSSGFRRFIEQRQANSKGDTLFILTADHGHISTPANPLFEVRNHPELLDCLVMYPSGEARMPFVYLRPGREEHFLKYLESTWPGLFHMIPSEQVIRSGLFGSQIYERFPDRVGDYVIFPQDSAYWWFAPDRDNFLLGRHGGLSKTEMLSPFFAFVL